MPPCEGGLVDGPHFNFIWPDTDFPCESPIAKVIYVGWEAFGKDGSRSEIFDRITVYKLTGITVSDNIWCPQTDSIYCEDPEHGYVKMVSRILLPRHW